ncbi:MAG: hypothetical protein HBSAPP02_22280 [Phycisphaerae bacterium]|nr:MAG: hypothetical protein HBSAPP02_22280 [Phycisphaerae bacterium]
MFRVWQLPIGSAQNNADAGLGEGNRVRQEGLRKCRPHLFRRCMAVTFEYEEANGPAGAGAAHVPMVGKIKIIARIKPNLSRRHRKADHDHGKERTERIEPTNKAAARESLPCGSIRESRSFGKC